MSSILPEHPDFLWISDHQLRAAAVDPPHWTPLDNVNAPFLHLCGALECATFPSGTAWCITHSFEDHGVGVSLRMDHRCIEDKPVLVAHSDQESTSHPFLDGFGKFWPRRNTTTSQG
jgi:hypothetical protein